MASFSMAREGAESNSIASLSVYAEFLPKLGRISVVAHLPSRSTSETKAFVSDGGQSLVIQHGGVATKLVLPARIEQSSQQLSGDVPPGLDKLSWRLIAHPDELAAAGSGRPGFDSGAVPWSALDLKPGAGVSCRECDNIIVPRTRLREWKDLPSENWAEMMEFWHCHKPTSHKRVKLDGEEALEDQQASRGYGANNAIAAQMGVGFVDLTKMLFHNEDLSVSCHRTFSEHHSPMPGSSLHCLVDLITRVLQSSCKKSSHTSSSLPLPALSQTFRRA